ncbi:hypothetical protein MHAE_02725 [Mycobacterium haemophilum DSM 44634]|nr:hypothetical protein B586_12240 [Mycobacterium haemophilum DSM 44634]
MVKQREITGPFWIIRTDSRNVWQPAPRRGLQQMMVTPIRVAAVVQVMTIPAVIGIDDGRFLLAVGHPEVDRKRQTLTRTK